MIPRSAAHCLQSGQVVLQQQPPLIAIQIQLTSTGPAQPPCDTDFRLSFFCPGALSDGLGGEIQNVTSGSKVALLLVFFCSNA